MNDSEILLEFLQKIDKQAARKAELYDGINQKLSIDATLRLSIEELGEVATAVTRERLNSALDECIDLAHCTFLIYKAIKSNTQ